MAVACLGLIAVAIAYAPSLSGPFVFDDLNAFTGPNYAQSVPAWRSLIHPEDRAVVSLSFLITDSILGSDAFGRRLGNVVIHLVACCVAFRLAYFLAPNRVQQKSWFALAVASLWGIHPLSSQAVAYIIQRAESLMSLFLFSLLLVGVQLGTANRTRRTLLFWSVFVLGLYTKTVMIAALAVCPLFDRAFLFKSWREVWYQRKLVYGPPLLVGMLSVIVLAPALMESKAGVGYGGDAPPVHIYLMTQIRSIGQYSLLSVWPSQLAIDRGPHFVTSPDQIVPESLYLVVWCVTALLLWFRFDNKAVEGKKIALLMVAPLLILAPSSSLVPTADPMFEHRMYAPLFFLVAWICVIVHYILFSNEREISVGYLLCEAPEGPVPGKRYPTLFSRQRHAMVAGLCTVVFALLFVRTTIRCREYAAAPLLWASAIRVDPNNDRAIQNFVTAMNEQQRSHLIEPALGQLIAEASAGGRVTDPTDLDSLRMYQAMEWVARGDVASAIPVLQQTAADDRSPETLFTYRQRRDYSTRYVNLAIAYRQAGRLQEAYKQIKFALSIDDTPPFGCAIAGYIAQDLGKDVEAIAHWERALKLRTEEWPELQADLQLLRRKHSST